MSLKIEVVGVPIPQGSKRAFINPKTQKPVVVEQAGQKHKDWRREVKSAAIAATENENGWPHKDGPIGVEILFIFDRPKSHYNTAGTLMDKTYAHPAPFYHTSMPDIDKLVRAILDSLTGVCFKDDAQVSFLTSQKVYARPGEMPGARIQVSRIAGGQLT